MWTAVTLWLAAIAGMSGYAIVAWRSVAAGSAAWPWIGGVFVLYFGIVLFLCGVYFAIAWLWRARRPREVRIGWRATFRLVWREYRTLAGAAPRMMFYGWLVRDPAPARVDIPVLLLHGVLCNAGVWMRMTRYLTRRGLGGLYSLSYGPPLASIEDFADQVAAKIDAIVQVTGARSMMIVAHSMGGLVIRAYARKYGTAKLARVLTIGSPHHGSMHAWLLTGTSLAQLRPGNAWLAALNRTPLDPALRFVSLWSWHDSMVAPQTSAELPGSIDVTVIGVGHNALLGDREVFERTHAEIVAARADARRHDV
jgi:triacylglycerol esterase/lipase EstA (alpha/beta hydrolase family)